MTESWQNRLLRVEPACADLDSFACHPHLCRQRASFGLGRDDEVMLTTILCDDHLREECGVFASMAIRRRRPVALRLHALSIAAGRPPHRRLRRRAIPRPAGMAMSARISAPRVMQAARPSALGHVRYATTAKWRCATSSRFSRFEFGGLAMPQRNLTNPIIWPSLVRRAACPVDQRSEVIIHLIRPA